MKFLQDDHAGMRQRLTQYFKCEIKDEPVALHKLLDECFKRYFAGEQELFALPICYWGSPVAKAVQEAMRKIHYGATATYTDVARLANYPIAVRAVASAVGQNPFVIVSPCHRVIRKDGGIGGYSAHGGLDTKRKLMQLEKIPLNK